eukprot:Em0013g239a
MRRLYSTLRVKAYDAVVVGGGRIPSQGGKEGWLSLRGRHVLGGAAVTEEIIPGYKFSRASYALSLLRPQIANDLELKLIHSHTWLAKVPYPGHGRNSELQADCTVLAQRRSAKSIEPLLDSAPINLHKLTSGSLQTRLSALKPLVPFTMADILKSTLAADAITGEMYSPMTQGSGYALLHNTMGGYNGDETWCYVEGGMGSVSMAIAKAAQLHGAELHTEKPVQQIIVKNNVVEGVLLQDGTVVRAKTVLSNATPKVTFFDLLSDKLCFDIPVALRGLPNFITSPNTPGDPRPGPHHQCLIFLNCESIETIHQAYLDCLQGEASSRPLIEMCMPSSLDPTLAPEGCHVLSLFTQYTPYQPASGPWNDENKEKYCQKVFDCIEEYAPGFKQLVVGKEVLTPPDLERIFGLTGGSIFHGSMSLDQLYMFRPIPLNPGYATTIKGLYLCGSGTHPGGGVMGSPGRLAATAVLEDM